MLLKTYILSLGLLTALVSITACGEVPAPVEEVEPISEVEAEVPVAAAPVDTLEERSVGDSCARGCDEQSQAALVDCVAGGGEAARTRCPERQATVRYECMASECEQEGRRRDGRSEALRICERECGVMAKDGYEDCARTGSIESCTEEGMGEYTDCVGGCPE